MIEFSVIGKVRGKPRPRLTRDGHAYTPQEGREYERQIRAAFCEAIADEQGAGPLFPMGISVKLRVMAYHKIPAYVRSPSVRRRMAEGLIPCIHKPDIDNVLKAVADALNGVAYEDDRQITYIIAHRRWTEGEERLEVEVAEDK